MHFFGFSPRDGNLPGRESVDRKSSAISSLSFAKLNNTGAEFPVELGLH